MQVVKFLQITPKSKIAVTDEPIIFQTGLAPDNFEEILDFIGEVLLVETDKFIIFSKVMDEFGKRRDVMAFAWAVICGTTLAENLIEVIETIAECDEGEIYVEYPTTGTEGPGGMFQ